MPAALDLLALQAGPIGQPAPVALAMAGVRFGRSVASADVNADGRADLALTGHAGWSAVSVAFARAGNTFAVTSELIAAFGLWASMPTLVRLSVDSKIGVSGSFG